MKRVLKRTLDLIGDTPILKLQKIVPENAAEVWLKYEAVNPTGSYKDRMAKSVLVNALKRGDVSQGDKVVEYTGAVPGRRLLSYQQHLDSIFVQSFQMPSQKASSRQWKLLMQM